MPTIFTGENVKEQQSLSRLSFVQYKEHLQKEVYTISTINKKINSLKVYNDFLRSIRVLNESIVALKRNRIKISAGSENTVVALSKEQVENLLCLRETK